MSRMAEVGQAEEVAYCEMEEVEVYCGTWVVDGRKSGDMTTWSKNFLLKNIKQVKDVNQLTCCSLYWESQNQTETLK